MSDDGGSAFPTVGRDGGTDSPGLSLRDYFAAQIAQGDAAQGDGWDNECPDRTIEKRCRLYYRIADSMLEVRQPPTPGAT